MASVPLVAPAVVGTGTFNTALVHCTWLALTCTLSVAARVLLVARAVVGAGLFNTALVHYTCSTLTCTLSVAASVSLVARAVVGAGHVVTLLQFTTRVQHRFLTAFVNVCNSPPADVTTSYSYCYPRQFLTTGQLFYIVLCVVICFSKCVVL